MWHYFFNLFALVCLCVVVVLIMVLGFYCFFTLVLLMRMRLEVLRRESRSSWVKAEVGRLVEGRA